MKVLLCLNGDKGNNKPVLDRDEVLLRYALDNAGIDYTYNYEENYDIVHVLSLDQYHAYLSKPKHKMISKHVPIVFSAFNDFNDLSSSFKEDVAEEAGYMDSIQKTTKIMSEIDKIICNWPSQILLLKHLGASGKLEEVPLGSKTYKKNSYSATEINAFRKYYQLESHDKIIVSYGEYTFSKGLDVLEQTARVLPGYEFFFFGGRNGILSNPNHFGKINDIPNLHYEDHMPEELYHSAMFSTSALFLPYKYHVDSTIIVEAMKAGIPVVANNDPLLFDLLISNKTACLGETVEEYYNYLKNISMTNYAKEAKEFTNKLTIENYGHKLSEVYLSLINNETDLLH